MRAWMWILVAAVGCNVPDRHYTKPGDAQGSGRDGGIDGNRDAPIDGTVAQPLTKAYQIDYINGIYRATKDPNTGMLTMVNASPVPSGGSVAAITNKQGTHLYTLDQTANAYALRDYTINLDGSLTPGPITQLGTCNPFQAALHPNGNFLAVGCNSHALAIVPINANGSLGAANIVTIGGGSRFPAFTPNGQCVFFTNVDGASTFDTVLIYSFDATTGAITQQTDQINVPAMANGIAVHPNGAYVYVAGAPALQAFRIGANCLLTTYGNALTIGNNTNGVTIDPAGNNLFVEGSEIYWFSIATDGSLTAKAGNPFFAGSPTMQGTVMDPLLPNTLYITGQAFPGTIVATVGANAISQSQSFSNDSNIHWLQLAP